MSAGAGEVVPPLQDDAVDFSFYGLTLNVAKLNPVEVKSVFNSDVSAAWNKYKKRDVAPVLTTLGSLSSSLGLNDWFVFQLVRQYVDALLKSATPMDRMVLDHYLLMEMGYDVRLARTERQLVLLVPFKQEVYEHDFVKIEGKDYYLYFDDLDANRDEQSVLYPCDPSKKDLGKGQALSLLFDGEPLKLRSGSDKCCEYDDGNIRLSCMVNKGVMEMLRDYPMMDLRCYVTSVVMPQFQHSILEQMKPQLEDYR